MPTPEFNKLNPEGTPFHENDEVRLHEANPDLLSFEEVRASRTLVNAALTAEQPATEVDAAQQSTIETHIPFDQLSEQVLSERVKRIRKEMLNGTRKDFDLGA